MIAARLKRAEQFDLVEAVVTVAVRHAIDAALELLLVVVDAGVERAERKHHAVDGADLGGHLLDGGALQGFARGGRREAVEAAVLIARVDAAAVVSTEVDPRALLDAGHGVDEFDGEAGRDLEARNGRGLVLVDGGADLGGAIGRSGFFLRGLGGGRVAGHEHRDKQDTEGAGSDFQRHEGSGDRGMGMTKTQERTKGVGRSGAEAGREQDRKQCT